MVRKKQPDYHTKEKFYEFRGNGYSEQVAFESCIEAGMDAKKVSWARFQYRLEATNTLEHQFINHLREEGFSHLEIIGILKPNNDFFELDLDRVIRILGGIN